jgi:hypothetical protein
VPGGDELDASPPRRPPTGDVVGDEQDPGEQDEAEQDPPPGSEPTPIDEAPRPPNPPSADDGEEVRPPSLDAGFVGSLDAATPIVPTDASVDAGACEGRAALELCWYLARPGASCAEHCAEHGGFDERAERHVGTPWQGGSAGDCARVLGALGLRGLVIPAARYDLRGLGCHRWAGTSTYWIESPYLARFGPDESSPYAELTCACLR